MVIEVLNEEREAVMLIRRYFLHYRLIREAITAVAIAGAALLFSYLNFASVIVGDQESGVRSLE